MWKGKTWINPPWIYPCLATYGLPSRKQNRFMPQPTRMLTYTIQPFENMNKVSGNIHIVDIKIRVTVVLPFVCEPVQRRYAKLCVPSHIPHI